MNESFSDLSPESAPPVDNDHVAEGVTLFTPEKIAANAVYPAAEEPKEPLSASEVLNTIKSDEGAFIEWALESTISFLDLADLPPVQNVGSLRGQSESLIRDKIQIANSVLVLLANYGSKNDNEELVKSCETYAEKMKTIIKRLCL